VSGGEEEVVLGSETGGIQEGIQVEVLTAKMYRWTAKKNVEINPAEK